MIKGKSRELELLLTVSEYVLHSLPDVELIRTNP